MVGLLTRCRYLAPTRALCSEKARDWQAKFADLKLSVKEITGDMPFDGHGNILDFIHADIVVTTVCRLLEAGLC